MATAQVYIKRLYTRVEIRRTNPYLVIATAVYLACKMEECPQHIRMLTQEARQLWPGAHLQVTVKGGGVVYPNAFSAPDFHSLDTSKVGECEFFLISEINSQLIVHQPYRTLTELQNDFSLSPDEVALAWSVINDHFMTDLPLLYPPHIIALTAILLTITLRPSSVQGGGSGSSNGGAATAAASMGGIAAATAALAQAQSRLAGGAGNVAGTEPGGGEVTPREKTQDARMGKVQRFAIWLAESGVDIGAMIGCTQELISFYECLDQYNDKNTRDQINRIVKARSLDR